MSSHKVLAGKKGGITRAINDAVKNGREVPQALQDELEAVIKEIDDGMSSTLLGKRKLSNPKKRSSKNQLLDTEADASLDDEGRFEDALEGPDEVEGLLNGGPKESKRMKVETVEKLLGFAFQVSPPSYIPSSVAVSQA